MDSQILLTLPALQKRLREGAAGVLKGANSKGWVLNSLWKIWPRKPEIGGAGPAKRHNGGQRRTRRSEKRVSR
jgi:hypothetical protein